MIHAATLTLENASQAYNLYDLLTAAKPGRVVSPVARVLVIQAVTSQIEVGDKDIATSGPGLALSVGDAFALDTVNANIPVSGIYLRSSTAGALVRVLMIEA